MGIAVATLGVISEQGKPVSGGLKSFQVSSSGVPSFPAFATANPTITFAPTINTISNDWQPQTTTQLQADLAGWCAAVTLNGLTSITGTVDATKVSISVTDPGYTTSGSATTVNRTITGVAVVKRLTQDPLWVLNNQKYQITTDGTNVTILISLSDWIYAGTTINSVTVSSGFYTGSIASGGGAISNLSDIPYPVPGFGWITPQFLSTDGANTIPVEGVAFHRHPYASQQVACIKYQATDGTHYGSISTVGSTSTSAVVTQGNIPEVWAANVDCSTLTQSAACTVNAIIYPWIGNKTAVFALAQPVSGQVGYVPAYTYAAGQTGVAWPSQCPQTPLQFVCDKNHMYGTAWAYVQVGAGAGTVQSSAAAASATPFATIDLALAAIKIYNNANNGHNDFGGSYIRLMNTSSSPASINWLTTTVANAAGQLAWWTVEVDPAAAGPIALTQSTSGIVSSPSLLRLRVIPGSGTSMTFSCPAGSADGIFGTNTLTDTFLCDGLAISNPNSKNTFGWWNISFFYNLSLSGANTIGLGTNEGVGGSSAMTALRPIMAGVTATVIPIGGGQFASMIVGCVWPSWQYNQPAFFRSVGAGVTLPLATELNGWIIYNNRLKGANATIGSPTNWQQSKTFGAYIGSIIINNTTNNLYQCTAFSSTGVTAASGTGPSGTGTGIVDNTLTWQYAGTFPVTIAYGPFVVQNLLEVATPDSAGLLMHFYPDNDNTVLLNCVDMYNTAVGTKCNQYYNDLANSQLNPYGIRKWPAKKYSMWDDVNRKNDGTIQAFDGAPGNWGHAYSVGEIGCVSLFGVVNRAANAVPVISPLVEASLWTTTTVYPVNWIVFVTAVNSGNNYICTLAGTSGASAPTATGSQIADGSCTWSRYTANSTSTAWAQNTAYIYGDLVKIGSNYFFCTIAGTSASSGAGPTGTGAAIVDGTATWSSYTTQAVVSSGIYLGMAANPTSTLNLQQIISASLHGGTALTVEDIPACVQIMGAFHSYTVGPWGDATLWTTNHVYATGVYVTGGIVNAGVPTAGGATWLCTVGGTSAASGNGPDATGHIVGDTVTDNTATWQLAQFPYAVGGDYRPLSGNATAISYIMSRVPSGQAGLTKDLAGVARKNDGTGAAGAYEAAS